tara:strand:+ start:3983 stop:4246 length:264 start_codon:yes stop_codon:yes gene_type:complete
MLSKKQKGGASKDAIRRMFQRLMGKKKEPTGREAAKKWVKENPGKSLKGTSKDFEVSWANYLREKGLTNQNPGKKRHGGAVGPNGIL